MPWTNTHCFSCGRDLDAHLADIGTVRDQGLYGLFPGFVSSVTRAGVAGTCAKLRTMTAAVAEPLVHSIPIEWEVSDITRVALVQHIVERATFVADTIEEALGPTCWPPADQELF